MQNETIMNTIPQPLPRNYDPRDKIVQDLSVRHSKLYFYVSVLGTETPIDTVQLDLFDDVLSYEVEKLEGLCRLHLETDEGRSTILGDIMLSQIKSFADRLNEMSFHVGRNIGDIELTCAYLHARSFDPGTVFDAELKPVQ